MLDKIEEYQYQADNIVFEITEGLMIQDFHHVQTLMKRLHREGIRFALDDFGIGYSSFSYISNLPLHYIKIDKSIVQGLLDKERGIINCKIVESIVQISQSVGIIVVAEGIETGELLHEIQSFDVALLQGFLFEAPTRHLLLPTHVELSVPERRKAL